MVLVATLCLTIFHPGYFFPQMQNGYQYSKGEGMMTQEKDLETSS